MFVVLTRSGLVNNQIDLRLADKLTLYEDTLHSEGTDNSGSGDCLAVKCIDRSR